MKTIAILLSWVNSLAAALVMTASATSVQWNQPASALWNGTKVAIGAAIIASGILTWIAVSRVTNQPLVFLAGIFLITLGTASAVWTVHIALSNGSIKDHVFLYGGSLMAQGAVALWNLLQSGRAPTTL